MKIKAWMKMGTERRETEFDIPDEEAQGGLAGCQDEGNFEFWLEEYVFEWLQCQFGWGWSGGGFENDFSSMENSGGLRCVTSDSAMPNTIRSRESEP